MQSLSPTRFSAPIRRLAALLLAVAVAVPLQAQPVQPAWIATWTASPQPRWDGDFALPSNLPFQFFDQTVVECMAMPRPASEASCRASP